MNLSSNRTGYDYKVNVNLADGTIQAPMPIMQTDYMKNLLLKASATLYGIEDYYAIDLPFNRRLVPDFSRNQYDGLNTVSEQWNALKSKDPQRYNEINRMVEFNRDMMSVETFERARYYSQEQSQEIYEYFSSYDPEEHEYAESMNAVRKIGHGIYNRTQSKAVDVISNHFDDNTFDDFKVEFNTFLTLSRALSQSDLTGSYERPSIKTIYNRLMDIGDINLIKEFKKTFVDPNGGDEGSRYAQRIKYELGLLIDINDKNISAKDFFVQSSLPKSNVNRYNTAVELSHTVSQEYYKEFTNLVSLGNNLKEAAKKGFMEFADFYEEQPEKTKQIFKEAFANDHAIQYRFKEYDDFFNLVMHHMRGGEILPYAKEHCIGKTTMLEYAKRHLKFQIALHEELEQPLPKSDEPVEKGSSLDM